MLSNPPGDGDFTSEEVQFLEHNNLFGPKIAIGKRKVSTLLISPPASTGSVSGSSASSSAATVRMLNFKTRTQQGTFEIPTSTVSADALEFIGFDQPTAKTVYERFVNRPNPDINVDSFLDYATSQALQIWVLKAAAHTDREAMAPVGLTIYETETLLFWVHDTLKVGYAALEQLHERLKHYVEIKRFSQAPEGYSLPANFIYVETEPALPSPLAYVVLYKGMAAADTWAPLICDDGSVDINILSAIAGGDFNYCFPVHYWTPQRRVAELYREWAERRGPQSETWVVRICVPIAFINSIPTTELWYSPDWKELVWYSRRKQQPPEKFNDLDPENRVIGLIKGHISTKIAQQAGRIKEEDVQSTINDGFVLSGPITGSMGTQWAFTTRRVIDRLGVEIRGRIHIDVTAAPQEVI
ncbi:hypothetical protein VE03_09537 [Pseudogymnoascus sp. 23342-1-I1]|nr:hypothetical protein VE03_09537 [Pseudogymnoascus sp. 23342-1-I1]